MFGTSVCVCCHICAFYVNRPVVKQASRKIHQPHHHPRQFASVCRLPLTTRLCACDTMDSKHDDDMWAPEVYDDASVSSLFERGPLLGEGAFGKVYAAVSCVAAVLGL